MRDSRPSGPMAVTSVMYGFRPMKMANGNHPQEQDQQAHLPPAMSRPRTPRRTNCAVVGCGGTGSSVAELRRRPQGSTEIPRYSFHTRPGWDGIAKRSRHDHQVAPLSDRSPQSCECNFLLTASQLISKAHRQDGASCHRMNGASSGTNAPTCRGARRGV